MTTSYLNTSEEQLRKGCITNILQSMENVQCNTCAVNQQFLQNSKNPIQEIINTRPNN
jgi:hypothetical protein